MQRLRVTFGRGNELKYLSHLDLDRLWQRALRRADLPVSNTQGFNPRLRLAFAAPLPVGVTARAELVDVWLDEPLGPEGFAARLRQQLPSGLEIASVEEVDLEAPALQAAVRHSDYLVVFPSGTDRAELRARVERFLALTELPHERARKGRVQHYDLRAQVYALRVEPAEGAPELFARLRTDVSGAGRVDELLAALGYDPTEPAVERVGLFLGAAE